VYYLLFNNLICIYWTGFTVRTHI